MQPETDPRRVTVATAARRVGVHPETLRHWIRHGLVPGSPDGLVDVDDLDRRAAEGLLPLDRRTPRPAGALPPTAGLLLSWPEVDLVLAALHDASEMRAALWAALSRDEEPGPEPHATASAQYALMSARLGIARHRAVQAGVAVVPS